MKFKLLLLLFFCSLNTFAQIQNQPGNLTLFTGEVLQGAVTYYYDNPGKIVLHGQEGAKEVYSPKQVQQIMLQNGEKFVSRPYLHQDSLVVLQVLIESPQISLFVREDGGDEYFYVSRDRMVHRLENNKTIVDDGAKTYSRRDNRYVGTLGSLMPDRLDLTEKLHKIRLTESELADVITEYNKGQASYVWKTNGKVAKEPNWVLFTQYSQFGSIYGYSTVAKSAGQMVGVQYYFSKHSRYSLKFSLDFASYYLDDEEVTMKGLGIRYQHEVKKMEKFSFYFMVHLADIGQLSSTGEGLADTEGNLVFLPRLSPGLGIEIKPLPKAAVYAELNNMTQLGNIPKSFSLGLKYDFGSTSW